MSNIMVTIYNQKTRYETKEFYNSCQCDHCMDIKKQQGQRELLWIDKNLTFDR